MYTLGSATYNVPNQMWPHIVLAHNSIAHRDIANWYPGVPKQPPCILPIQ